MIEYFLDVRLKEVGWNFVLLQEAVDVSDTLFGVFLHAGNWKHHNELVLGTVNF